MSINLMANSMTRMDLDGFWGLIIIIAIFVIRNIFSYKKKVREQEEKLRKQKAAPPSFKEHVPKRKAPIPRKIQKEYLGMHAASKESSHEAMKNLKVDEAYRIKRKKCSEVRSIIKRVGPKKNLIFISEILNRKY